MERTSLAALSFILSLGVSSCAAVKQDPADDQDRLQDCKQGSDCDLDRIRNRDGDDDPDQDRDRDSSRDGDSDSDGGQGKN